MSEEIILSNLGKKIKTIRSRKHITQHMLAEKCQIEKAGLSKLESGQSNPTVRTLYKISSALEVSISELFRD